MNHDPVFHVTLTRKTKHDLMTPLNQIIGYAELMREELNDPEATLNPGDIDRISDAAQRLLRDLNALFDVERPTESGTEEEAEPDLPLNDTFFGREVPTLNESVASDSGLRMPGGAAKVLLVDDSDQNREILTRRLAQYGYEVRGVTDGYEALEVLPTAAFDLVLLDISMPGMNGFEVLARIRERQSRASLPVIMTTAHAQPRDIVEGLRRGANDFVPKPIHIPLLLARMETHLIVRQHAGKGSK